MSIANIFLVRVGSLCLLLPLGAGTLSGLDLCRSYGFHILCELTHTSDLILKTWLPESHLAPLSLTAFNLPFCMRPWALHFHNGPKYQPVWDYLVSVLCPHRNLTVVLLSLWLFWWLFFLDYSLAARGWNAYVILYTLHRTIMKVAMKTSLYTLQ